MSHSLNTVPTLHPLLASADVHGLVFDLDGTLIDSGADILQGMRLTFEEAGIGLIPQDYFPDNMHGTAEGILRSIAADMGWAMPAEIEPLRRQYQTHAATLDLQRTRLYDGVLEVLQACQTAALPMGICTNKSHAGALSATHKFGIHDMFGFITGSDTWAEAKPSPLPLQETLRMLHLEPQNCLYFGDTSTDAACAQAAGVRFILFESGYGDRELADHPRHFAFSDWNALLADQSAIA